MPTPAPTATPTPAPVERVVIETPCCGLFSWFDADRLLVYDQVEGESNGAWLVDVTSGVRSFVGPNFGLPSESGLIAFPSGDGGVLEIRTADGAVVQSFSNGGDHGWISPNGERVAWLSSLGVPTPSSSLNRIVRLHVGEIESGDARGVIDLQAAEVHWMPDSSRLLVPARDTNAQNAGIWLIDVGTGDYEVVIDERFLQAVRLSPDGEHVAFMRTFNDDSDQNGVWVLDLTDRTRQKVAEQGAFRWDADGASLWFLELRDNADRLVGIDSSTGDSLSDIVIDGRVLNDTWSISPAGDYVAYWRERDRQVTVQSLPR